MQSASTHTGKVPDLHGHVSFANFAEMEGDGRYDIFTPLRSRIQSRYSVGSRKVRAAHLAVSDDINQGSLAGCLCSDIRG